VESRLARAAIARATPSASPLPAALKSALSSRRPIAYAKLPHQQTSSDAVVDDDENYDITDRLHMATSL
jgi:hypothetical protein